MECVYPMYNGKNIYLHIYRVEHQAAVVKMFSYLRNCMFGWNSHESSSKLSPATFLAVVSIFCAMSTAQEYVSSDERRVAALQAVTTSNLNFTCSMYEILSQQQGNVFFSPLSIQLILALAYMGAQGSTASQMASALQLPADKELTKEGFHALISSLKCDKNITLDIANKIFTDNSIPLTEEFQQMAQETFLSDAESVDFGNNFEAARVQINQWVEEKTNNKIQDLLEPGILSAETAIVLVNAVYFKADWAIKFDAAKTCTEQFFVTPTQTKDVQMMHVENEFGFTVSEELECKILEMSYTGDKLSFVVLLPFAHENLVDLEAKLTQVDLKELISNLEICEIDVALPKFKLEQFTDLNEVLKMLGMTYIFEDWADFTGLTETPVKVSKVVHKAFIEVNEEGSEAASATGMEISTRITDRDFRADHPFLFLLRERNTGTVLFMGRVSDVP